MICPKCGGRTFNTDTRKNNVDGEIYRRRQCGDCREVFYTVEYEIIDNAGFRKRWNEHHR